MTDKTSNIIPFDPIITQQDRHVMNAHKSGLIWLYGLSGSGKSTLAHQVEARLYQKGIRSYVLDGDNVRRGLNEDLGLSPDSPDLIVETDRYTLDECATRIIQFLNEQRLIILR